MPLNVRSYNNKEMLLFPACIGDYLSKDHLAWIIDDCVDELDLGCFYNKIPSIGNPSYHPKMILKILFYAYTQRTYSSRKIAGKLEADVAFIFLSGMQKPDFRTISDFRKNNLKEISELFVQIVRLCKKLGMVNLGHISIDSTVIKANAARSQSHTKDELDKEQERINQKIKELLEKARDIDDYEDRRFGKDKRGDEIPEAVRDHKERLKKIEGARKLLENDKRGKRVNLTDKDASLQRIKHEVVPGYRIQMVVDSEKQVIVSCDVAPTTSDNAQLEPLVEQAFKNTERRDDKTTIITADSAYSSMENLSNLEEHPNVDPYIPDIKYQAKQRNRNMGEESPFHKKNFKYDKEKDVYICPGNKELKFVRKKMRRSGNGFRSYRCRECESCGHFGVCTKTTNGRSINSYKNEHLIHQMRKKLDSPEGKLIYKKRKTITEPVFGNIKHNLGFREFLLRGLPKVKIELLLIAIAHNLLKIVNFVKKPELLVIKDKYLIPVPI